MKRCPNGTRKNKKTGNCEKKDEKNEKEELIIRQKENENDNNRQNEENETKKAKRCPKGTRRNKKTGLCEEPTKTNAKNKLSKTAKKTASEKISMSPSKKTAANKIARFMTKPHVQEKRRTEFLKSICSDSNVCIAFGIEDNKIQKFFNGFTDFQYAVAPIKRIGEVSANGFVNEIMYERNNYIAYSVLKSSVDQKSDNLMYEYIVGRYLNEMAIYFPCFLKTYGLYQYIGYINYITMQKNKSIDDTDILKTGCKELVVSDPPSDADLTKACSHSKYISVLIQHIKNATPIKNIRGMKIYFLLYQVYFTLHCMRDNYTHYDLHGSNVLCYEPVPNKYIEFVYHLNNGQTIDFVSTQLAYIIDYGRSYFYKNAKYNSKSIHNKICKQKICKVCGKDQGFGLLHGKYAKTYEVSPMVKNCSSDLRLLHLLKNRNIDLSEEVVFTKQYGTPEIVTSGLNETPRAIHNVSDAMQVLSEKVMQFKKEMLETMKSLKYTKLGTMHVYENGKTPVRFEKI